MQAADRGPSARQTVAGLFRDRFAAEQAIHALKADGFAANQIGVAMRDRTAQGELIEETGASAAASATTGALGGGLLGGLLGFLVGAGALAIPGIGPVVAGGVLASTFGLAGGTAIAGAGIGAAAGGMVGALVGMGIPEHEARHFETGLRAGGTLVTVGTGDRAGEARAILERHGADTGPQAYEDLPEPDREPVEPGRPAGSRPAPHAADTGTPEVVGGMVAGAAAGAVAGARADEDEPAERDRSERG